MNATRLVALLLVVLAACEAPEPTYPARKASPLVVSATAAAPPASTPAPTTRPPAATDPALRPPETFDLKAIDEYVAKQVVAQGLTGLSLAIVKDGTIVFAKGYGLAVLEPPAPVGADTAFHIGSVTKQFTCASIALLAEDKKLTVNDKVAKYFPEVTRAKDITLADLGNHVSGYRDYYPLDFVDIAKLQPIAPDDLIAKYGTQALDFEPRARFSYSNTGYIMLGRVVEKVSGQALGAFMQRRLFKPAGMETTSFAPKDTGATRNGVPSLAKGYTSFALGDPQPAEQEADGWIYAAGAISATASDLARWDLALLDGKILKPASFQWLTTPRTLSNGRSTGYGCGFNIGTRNGETVIQHAGSGIGFKSFNAMLPRSRSAVVMLTNRGDLNGRSIHEAILTLLSSEEPTLVKVQGPPVKEIASTLMKELQAGTLDRSRLGPDFDQFLSEQRMRGLADRLRALGVPTSVDVDNLGERGGMEVAWVRFTFADTKVRALIYRTPDGKVQQFLLSKP